MSKPQYILEQTLQIYFVKETRATAKVALVSFTLLP